MTKKKRSAATPPIAAPQLRSIRMTDGIFLVIATLIKYGFLLWIAKYGYMSIVALAGQKTIVGVGLLGNLQVSQALCGVLTVAFGAYGARQRALRRSAVEHLQNRNERLERIIDSKRSSSKLTARGETNPEDR
jgi:hypothetical protein